MRPAPRTAPSAWPSCLRRCRRPATSTLDDPLDAAHQFLGLVQNRFLKARLCNAIPDLAPQQIDEEAARAVSTFLRAFGTDRRP